VLRDREIFTDRDDAARKGLRDQHHVITAVAARLAAEQRRRARQEIVELAAGTDPESARECCRDREFDEPRGVSRTSRARTARVGRGRAR